MNIIPDSSLTPRELANKYVLADVDEHSTFLANELLVTLNEIRELENEEIAELRQENGFLEESIQILKEELDECRYSKS